MKFLNICQVYSADFFQLVELRDYDTSQVFSLVESSSLLIEIKSLGLIDMIRIWLPIRNESVKQWNDVKISSLSFQLSWFHFKKFGLVGEKSENIS